MQVSPLKAKGLLDTIVGILASIPRPSRERRRAHTLSRYRSRSRSTTCYALLVAREITQRELRNDSGEIMRELDRGESFVVTRAGVPVGELVPLRRHRFISADTAAAMFRGAPPIDYATFRSDLDHHASQNPTPRA